ncbi:unnamed protein product, partial [Closterium sp. Naga37s-1]
NSSSRRSIKGSSRRGSKEAGRSDEAGSEGLVPCAHECAVAENERTAAEQPTRALLLAVGTGLAAAGAAAAVGQALQHLARLLPTPPPCLSPPTCSSTCSHTPASAPCHAPPCFSSSKLQRTASQGMLGWRSICCRSPSPMSTDSMWRDEISSLRAQMQQAQEEAKAERSKRRAAEQQVEVERAAGRQAQEAMLSKVGELVDEVQVSVHGRMTWG